MTRQTLHKRRPIAIEKALGKLPVAPGVYFFLARNGKILYIGRATSLRNRIKSYFAPNIAERRSSWLAKMLPLIKKIDYRKTDSVLEAILLETDLIKRFQPPYNSDEKDDKSFNCVAITKEDFPTVLITRAKNIDFPLLTIKDRGLKILAVYGPFPQGFKLQTALKIIRRIFPWRDNRCIPCPYQKSKVKWPEQLLPVGKTCADKPCFNRQIELCPGTCTGEITRKEYAKTIRNIRLFFEGKKARLLKLLEKEMRVAAKRMEFEKAGEFKKQIFALKHIQDVSLLTRTMDYELQAPNVRVEAYDVSHFGGKEIVGAMAVVQNRIPRPSEYRLFKLRTIKGPHETAGLAEILLRRFNHPEWPFPQLIVVDGNEVQKAAAEKILAELGQTIPVVAVVKDEKHRPREVLGLSVLQMKDKGLRISALLGNAEAHRFALKFQRRQRVSPLAPLLSHTRARKINGKVRT